MQEEECVLCQYLYFSFVSLGEKGERSFFFKLGRTVVCIYLGRRSGISYYFYRQLRPRVEQWKRWVREEKSKRHNVWEIVDLWSDWINGPIYYVLLIVIRIFRCIASPNCILQDWHCDLHNSNKELKYKEY